MNGDKDIRKIILTALAEICATEEVLQNPQLNLWSNALLDSFGTVELFLTIQEQLGIEIAPTEVEREMWSTPEKIIHYLEEKRR